MAAPKPTKKPIEDMEKFYIDVDMAMETPVKKSRAQNKKNSPTAKEQPEGEEQRRYIRRLLTQILNSYQMPRVTNNQELAERFADYFKRCAAHGYIPTVEEAYLYTGYSYNTINDWRVGRLSGFATAETSEIIKNAQSFFAAYDAAAVVDGKINPIVYIFRGKNYYGLRDTQEHVISPAQQDTYDIKELEDKADILDID